MVGSCANGCLSAPRPARSGSWATSPVCTRYWRSSPSEASTAVAKSRLRSATSSPVIQAILRCWRSPFAATCPSRTVGTRCWMSPARRMTAGSAIPRPPVTSRSCTRSPLIWWAKTAQARRAYTLNANRRLGMTTMCCNSLKTISCVSPGTRPPVGAVARLAGRGDVSVIDRPRRREPRWRSTSRCAAPAHR